MRPLTKDEAFKTIVKLIGSANETFVIAPYFGKGAFEQLGFANTASKATIVCDLFSGACNPLEIKKFMKVWEPERILTLDRLHAKVYWTDQGIVVGSANPSSNGLGFEAGEAEGLFEACVASTDQAVIQEWRTFIEEQFLKGARKVRSVDIAAAIPIWKRNRQGRPKRSGDPKTVLAMMRENPEFFQDRPLLFIAHVQVEPSARITKLFKQEKDARQTPALDFWGDWEDAPGDTLIIEYLYSTPASSTPKYNGIFQTLANPVVRAKDGSLIALAHSVGSVFGLPVSPLEQKEIGRLLSKVLPTNNAAGKDSISGYELALHVAADPRPYILMTVSNPSYYQSVLNNMEAARKTGVPTVRFGTTGRGKFPNYEIEVTTGPRLTRTTTYRGSNHKPQPSNHYNPINLTGRYSFMEVQQMLAAVTAA